MLKNLKEKAGYISLETIIVAGLVLALGVFGMIQFYDAGSVTTEHAIDQVLSVTEVQPEAN